MAMREADILVRVCDTLTSGDVEDAAAILKLDYPFVSRLPAGRTYDAATSTRVFVLDGFIDRYGGERLVFPGVLRLLSVLLPEAFPFHPNWKMSATHPAYWQLFPTIDHVVPVALGGADEPANWVMTSMLRNSAKGCSTLDELGWRLHPRGSMQEWDGLMRWFIDRVAKDSNLLGDPYLKRWHSAATAAMR